MTTAFRPHASSLSENALSQRHWWAEPTRQGQSRSPLRSQNQTSSSAASLWLSVRICS